MRSIDVYLEDVSPEASTLIFLSILFSYGVYYLIQLILYIIGNQSSFKDDNDVLGALTKGKGSDNGSSNEPIVGTVVLCGPSNAGKTVLFHALNCDPLLANMSNDEAEALLSKIPMATVTSIQAADSYIPSSSSSDKIRLLDYPGHVSLRTSLPKALMDASRIVLVLDCSKPMADAADFLYLLLTNPLLPWNSSNLNSNFHSNSKMQVLIACHKSDLTLAKNPKRVKIQLRTELDRLRKIQRSQSTSNGSSSQSSSHSNNNMNDPDSMTPLPLGISGKPLDLDNKQGYLSCDLTFVATSCKASKSSKSSLHEISNVGGSDGGKGWQEIRHFVQGVAESM